MEQKQKVQQIEQEEQSDEESGPMAIVKLEQCGISSSDIKSYKKMDIIQ